MYKVYYTTECDVLCRKDQQTFMEKFYMSTQTCEKTKDFVLQVM